PIKNLVRAISKKRSSKDVKISILTDISMQTLIQGSTELPALLYLFENQSNVSITYLPRIHAKVYISNRSSAIITSANFTSGGEKRNFEYGVRINDKKVVKKIERDINDYRKLGALITKHQLEELHNQIIAVRKTIETEQKTIVKKLRLESRKLEREIEDNLIRTRVKNTSVNSIFSRTILYLLSRKPMSTDELQALIKNIHVDLCDETIDRIIDGKHFGKLWKHQVRNAQVYLKRAGLISYDKDTQLWNISKYP
ncbi:MAG: NgoFVII family restriction endonuclease, partial [Chloroflexi bacterium]